MDLNTGDFIVFSKISASLAKQIQDEGTDNIFSGRTLYIVVLAGLLTPLALKKMLKEIPVKVIMYDLLEWEGADYREQPMALRRAALDKITTEYDVADSAIPLRII